MTTTENTKNRLLSNILDDASFNQVVIYTSNNARAQVLQKLMESWCFPCVAITSNMSTNNRMKNFLQFKANEKHILITTDLFGRGVDVDKVNMVINYDFPSDSNAYLHRVGRAGRFGTKGITVSFVSSEEDKKVLKEVEDRFVAKMHVLEEPISKESFVVNWDKFLELCMKSVYLKRLLSCFTEIHQKPFQKATSLLYPNK